MQVLKQSVPQEILVLNVADNRRNLLETSYLGRPQTPLAHNELVAGIALIRAFVNTSHHNGLEQADFLHRRHQLGDLVLVKDLTRLTPVRDNSVQRQIRVGGPRNRDQAVRIDLPVGTRRFT